MRLLGRMLVLLLLLSIGYLAWRHAPPLPSPTVTALEMGLPEGVLTRTATTYLLDEERWTTFPLTTPEPYLRLLSNADLDPAESVEGIELHYTIAYRLRSDTGTLLHEGRFDNRSRIRWFMDPTTGHRYTSTIRYPPLLRLADGALFHLNLDGWGRPAVLELRTARMSPPVRRILMRVFQEENHPAQNAEIQWRRLSSAQQRRLAKVSVYPPELLSAIERATLINRRFVSLAPAGIEGEDYLQKKIYILGTHEGIPLESPVVPAGALFASERPLLIEIPPGGGKLRLELTPSVAGVTRGEVAFHWYGRPAILQRSWHLPWQGQRLEHRAPIDEGLLVVIVPDDGALRAWLQVAGEETEITPEPDYLRSYRIDRGAPLHLEISHATEGSTPLRLDLRTLEPGPAVVSYRLLGDGRSPEGGQWTIEHHPSNYDLLADAPHETLGEPRRFYLAIPPAVTVLRLEADRPMLAAAFVRPPGLPLRQVMPDHPLSRESQPAWFPLRTPDHDQRTAAGATRLLRVQPRPPDLDPDLVAGRYRWQSFRPEGPWAGRYLLTPATAEAMPRDESLKVRFSEVADTASLSFPDLFGGRWIQATLMYFRHGPRPIGFRVRLDGREIFSGQMSTAQGELTLPPFPPGRHALTIEGRGRFLINRSSSGTYLKRLGLRLGAKRLRFPLHKESEGRELLSFRIYSPPGESDVSLRIRIQGRRRPGVVYEEWTLLERELRIRPALDPAVEVLQGGGRRLDASRIFFVPLGADLPAGRYLIEIERIAGPESYLVLSRTQPGLHGWMELRYD